MPRYIADAQKAAPSTMSQQPCLPVPRRRKRQDEDEKVDFNNMDIESMDANEYLSAVVQEASALPVVFVADGVSKAKPAEQHYKDHVPIDGSAASLSYLTSKQTAVVPPPTAQHAPPNQKWVDMTLTNFSELRSYLDRCHEQGVGGKGTKRMSVPSLRDRSGWHVFCVGLDEARGNTGCYFDEDEQSDNEKNEDEFPEWRNNLPQEGYIPSVQLLLQMDQVMVRRVLSHLVHYVQDGWSAGSKQRSAWLYALLGRLDRPIHRDDAATLYGLLKDMTLTRANLKVSEDNQEELARLNTLIAIIGLYFEQGSSCNIVIGTV